MEISYQIRLSGARIERVFCILLCALDDDRHSIRNFGSRSVHDNRASRVQSN